MTYLVQLMSEFAYVHAAAAVDEISVVVADALLLHIKIAIQLFRAVLENI